jgi:hypothetical protein
MSEHVETGLFAALVRCGLSVAAILALVLAVTAMAGAQSASSSAGVQSAKSSAPSPGSASTPAKTEANSELAQAPSSGLNTGVKIHGHWKIVVRNPDGTVATRRDFENSLTFSGAFIMQTLLGGAASPGAWAISLGAQSSGDTGPCTGASFSIYNSAFPSPTSSGNCFIGETSGVYASNLTCSQITSCAPNLTRQQINFQTLFQTGTGPGGLPLESQAVNTSGFEISGTATANSGGTIDTVSTLVMLCTTADFGYQFTSTTYSLKIGNGPTTVDPATCATTVPPVGGRTTSPLEVVPYGTTAPVGGVFSSTILNGASATSTPPAPVRVVANQTIQVSVLFTFN